MKHWLICCICHDLFHTRQVIGRFHFCSELCWNNTPSNLIDTVVEQQ